jgi:hypothetical protein
MYQASLPRVGDFIDAAPVVTAVRRGLASLTALAHPTRRFVREGAESYFESGLIKRELQRL